MDKSIAVLLIAVVSVCSALQLDIMGPSHIHAKPGDKKELVCHLDMGPAVVFQYEINWQHIPFDGKPQDVSKSQELLADSNEYNLIVNYDSVSTNMTLELLNVKSEMDGKFTCEATELNKENPEVVSKTVDVTVFNEISDVVMTVDDEEIVDVSETAVQRPEGKYTVSCLATGSNPGATIELKLGEETLGSAEGKIDQEASEKAGAPRFSSMVSTEVELKGDHDMASMVCQAHVTSGDASSSKTVSTPVSVIVFEPIIDCERNSSARMGDRYVEITCIVDHASIEVKEYKWEVAHSEKIYSVADHNDTEVYNMVVVTPISEKKDKVTLQLYHANQDEDFNTFYFLDVITPDGRKFREVARLGLLDSTGGSSKLSAAFISFFLPLLLRL